MRNVKAVCLFLGAIALVMTVTGMNFDQSKTVIFTPLPWYQRLLTAMQVILFGALYFGIENRAIEAWWLGFIILGIGYVYNIFSLYFFLIDTLNSIFILVIWVVGSSLVTAYWGFWWHAKKNYFTEGSPHR